MLIDKIDEPIRVNARKTDVFDIFNLRHYSGPNPYLDRAALVFDFALTGYGEPLPIENYLATTSDRYPRIQENNCESYAELFAATVSEVSKLDMDLHLDRWSIKPQTEYVRIAIEALHARTAREVVYCVWDWLEAVTQDRDFDLQQRIESLQELFRQSVYGGPTVYALLRTARDQEIPTFYLWEEGLMQYGYGKKQIRGVATTFDTDSHIDSDFTTLKDDCKSFLGELGFPVPKGDVAIDLEEAKEIANTIGYPVAIKPVSGHKGNGVTADVQDEAELEEAFERAVEAIPAEERIQIIVENSIAGKDYRLLCVNGRFVAATERKPAYIVGDGYSTIEEMIDRENRSPDRRDTPTSPLGKIKTDEAMMRYLHEQGLTLDSVVESDRTVYLRKVANLSSGGLSIDATRKVHTDNIILTQDIAQHFRLTCLGIDVVASDISQSWKHSSFGIIEINAAPGIYMHLKPTVGEPIDVPARILATFFATAKDARIPIITFNQVSIRELQKLTDRILMEHPDWTVGAVCRDGIMLNRSEKILNRYYNTNILNLLRNPKLDLLIAEYDEEVLEEEGMFYYGSNLVVLNNPSETEMILARDVFDDSTIVIREQNQVTIKRKGLIEQYQLEDNESLEQVYLKEIATVV